MEKKEGGGDQRCCDDSTKALVIKKRDNGVWRGARDYQSKIVWCHAWRSGLVILSIYYVGLSTKSLTSSALTSFMDDPEG